MPASLGTEEALLGLILKKEAWTEKKAYLGVSSLKPSELTKKTTGKEFGEHEFKESEGWARVEIDAIEWEVEKAEGETGFTKFRNKNPIALSTIEGEEEKALETAAVLSKAKQSEDEASSSEIFVFGKLTTKITLNKATSSFEIPAKELVIECE